MAIYNGRILMRKGNEADFDPSKLMSGEWAVSLDAGIVRICLEAGKVIRMATYEAFEEDMKQIEAILLECQSIEEAVRRINTEVSEKLNACAEYVQQAKNYSEQAKTSEANAKSFMQSAKTSEENAKVSETNAKASENSAKEYENSAKLTEERAREVFESIPEDYSTLSDDFYALAIKETATGYEIHRTDSADMKLREFALFGKARQNTTSGKQLFDANRLELGTNNMLDISEDTYTITVSGGNKAYANSYYNFDLDVVRGKTLHIKLESISKTISEANSYPQFVITNADDTQSYYPIETLYGTVTIPEDAKAVRCALYSNNEKNALSETNTVVFKGLMVSFVDAEWEPYTSGQPSPNPQYPQPIEVSGESYNLLENTATSQEINGITVVVNEDKSITLNGKTNALTYVDINTNLNTTELKGALFSCFDGGGDNSFYIRISKSDRITLQNISSNNAIIEDNGDGLIISLRIDNGYTLNNVTIYPMIRKASVKNTHYMPYGVDRVEVKSVGANILGNLSYNQLLTDTSGIVVKLYGYWGAIIDVREMDNICISGDFTLLNSNIVRVGLFSEYPDIGTTGTRKNIITVGSLNVSDCNYVLLSFMRADYGTTEENGKELMDSIMVNSGTKILPYEPYKETLATIPTENGLAGIKVSSNGNYTDQNGQQWICDEIVKYADGSGAYIQRIAKLSNPTFSLEKGYTLETSELFSCSAPNSYSTNNALLSTIVCNKLQFLRSVLSNDTCGAYQGYEKIFARITGVTTAEEFNALMVDSEIYYILAEPIITPLTAEEIAEIEKLHTFYPITNISNDFDCGMSVTYYCDSKNYINNQLAIMKQEQEEAMMNILSLMPTEVQATMIENDTNELLKESEI